MKRRGEGGPLGGKKTANTPLADRQWARAQRVADALTGGHATPAIVRAMHDLVVSVERPDGCSDTDHREESP
ncbi:hypothetical protein [Mycobacterium sp. E3305]|uniref:hypothetical protein n=1 Tax=Mycobacterium sp. E3305 TaxID=1834145 RepID=UPI000AC9F84D|nr:hypothetical protein [Mycobacterium sp. E3305]